MCWGGSWVGEQVLWFPLAQERGDGVTGSAAGGRGRTAPPTVSREGAVLPDVTGLVEKQIPWPNTLGEFAYYALQR